MHDHDRDGVTGNLKEGLGRVGYLSRWEVRKYVPVESKESTQFILVVEFA